MDSAAGPSGLDSSAWKRLCSSFSSLSMDLLCRRILGKAILRVIKPDFLEAAGCLQLCAGQDSGCDAAVHCVQKIFQYFPNPLTTRLLDKEEHLEKAEEVFMNTGIWVTTDGSVVLGS